MNTTATSLTATAPQGTLFGFLRDEWPYLVMIVLSLIGVAYSTIMPQSGGTYWQVIAPIFGLICIVTQWPRAYPKGKHWRLIATQAIHWGVFALSMYLLFLPQVQQVMDAFMTGLILLYLLAMSTFLVGVYYAAWRLCVVGIFLALAIPALALFEEAALGLFGVAILLIAGIYLYHRYRGERDELAY